jgi:four helix bundle protein
MAQGSNYEVQTQLLIAKRLGLGSSERIQQAEKLNAEVGRMLTAFIATVQQERAKGQKLEARS